MQIPITGIALGALALGAPWARSLVRVHAVVGTAYMLFEEDALVRDGVTVLGCKLRASRRDWRAINVVTHMLPLVLLMARRDSAPVTAAGVALAYACVADLPALYPTRSPDRLAWYAGAYAAGVALQWRSAHVRRLFFDLRGRSAPA